MVGFMAIFGFLGHKLDEYFAFQTPFLTLTGLLFGVIGSLVYLIRNLTKKP
jgi:hypothetical protein